MRSVQFYSFYKMNRENFFKKSSVVDLHRVDADPDPIFDFNADPVPNPAPVTKQMMEICDNWSIDPLGHIYEPAPSNVSVHGPPTALF
jgi:hypothetical protein